jgi:antitoxin component YwqK of YwqJK toxin-antitoxin module
MKKIILVLITGLMLVGCLKPTPKVHPLDYDKSKTIAPMKNGKLDGVRKAYSGNGNIMSVTSYKNGKKDGVEKQNDRHAKLWNETWYKDGKKDGPSKEWEFSGSEISEYTVTPYKNDLKHGTEIEYFPDGAIRVKVPYVNGKREGVTKVWNRDGSLWMITPYKNNERDGIVKKYENGYLTHIGAYSNGKQYGIHKSYSHLNGKIAEAVPYVDGKLDGRGKIYDENGSLKYTMLWVDGVEKETTYSEKEKKRMQKKQKKATKRSRGNVVSLKCGWDESHPSMSEVSRKKAIAKGKGEGAALGYQMKNNNTISTGKLEASNYCTQNANAEGLACTYAKIYLNGCMRTLGY